MVAVSLSAGFDLEAFCLYLLSACFPLFWDTRNLGVCSFVACSSSVRNLIFLKRVNDLTSTAGHLIFSRDLLYWKRQYRHGITCCVLIISCKIIFFLKFVIAQPGLRLGSAVTRLLGLWVRIPPWTWLSLSYECGDLSGTVLCDGPIPRSGES